MASENRYWGQRRIQAELVRLGFKVSARTVAKYMRGPYTGRPSPSWREFLKRHACDIWACDFFCVQTIWFRTFYVFFAIRHANREVLHVQVTSHPTAEWVAQQIVECCGWDRQPPRFLIHDRDSRYGKVFDRRVSNLGIRQIRTPFRSPRANAIAERWVRSPEPSIWTSCSSSASAIYDAHWLSMLAISTVGGHTGRLGNVRPVRHRELSKATSAATLLPGRFWVGSIISTIWPHDHPDEHFAPYSSPKLT
jgi:transposase InsO family protein